MTIRFTCGTLFLILASMAALSGCAIKPVGAVRNGGDAPPYMGMSDVYSGDLSSLGPGDCVVAVSGDLEQFLRTSQATVVLLDDVERQRQEPRKQQRTRKRHERVRKQLEFEVPSKQPRMRPAKRTPFFEAAKLAGVHRTRMVGSQVTARLDRDQRVALFFVEVRNVGTGDFTGDVTVLDRLGPGLASARAVTACGLRFNAGKIVLMCIPFGLTQPIAAVLPDWVPSWKESFEVEASVDGDLLIMELYDVHIPKARGVRFQFAVDIVP